MTKVCQKKKKEDDTEKKKKKEDEKVKTRNTSKSPSGRLRNLSKSKNNISDEGGETSSTVQFLLSEEHSSSDSESDPEPDSDEDIFITPPESPIGHSTSGLI